MSSSCCDSAALVETSASDAPFSRHLFRMSPARGAAPKLGKLAATVVGGAAGRGRSRKVADVITPRVPSDPTIRLVRSYPATPLIVRRPVRSTRPSASTTSSPSTASRVTPYFTQRSPPALVARLPPIVEL